MTWHSPIGRRTEKVYVDEVLIFKLHLPFAANRDDGCFKATHSWKAHKSIYQGCLTRQTWRFGRWFRTWMDGHTCPSVRPL